MTFRFRRGGFTVIPVAHMPRLLLLLSLFIVCTASSEAVTRKKKPVPEAPVVKPQPVKIPSAAGKPNILFVIVDDLNDWVGWLGHPQARTPNMDRLAHTGMRFTNAHTAFALCNPSRTALLTGMAPASSGVFGNEQDWRRSIQITGKPTLPEFFRSMGFDTSAGGKIYHANHGGPDALLAGWHGGRRGFEVDAAWMTRFPEAGVQLAEAPVHTGRNFNGLDIWHWDWGPINFPDDATEDGQTVAWASDFISKHSTKQPFFLAVGLYKPHSPWYAPKAYFDERPLDQVKLPEVKADDLDDVPAFAKDHLSNPENFHAQILKNNLWPAAVRAYLASIPFADAQLGTLLAALETSPAAKNTIVCLTSDHGWYLGEKQMWHKGKLWERATHVPLSIYAPGVTTAESVSTQPVSLLDLYPTFCDLAQLKAPEHLDGESIVPLLTDPTLKRVRPAITTMGGEQKVSYSARSEQWRYIRYADGSEELYDHHADPNEWSNVAAKPQHAALKQELASFFPKEWHSAHRSTEQLGIVNGTDGSVFYELQPGDEIEAKDSPPIVGRGFCLEASIEYNPAVDQNSTLLSQGDDKDGWVLHLVDGSPTFTFFIGGKRSVVALDGLKPGPAMIRAQVPANGTISLAVTEQAEIIDQAPFPGGFPVQPKQGLKTTESFCPLKAKDYPNSTPFDGAVHRLTVEVLPPGPQ